MQQSYVQMANGYQDTRHFSQIQQGGPSQMQMIHQQPPPPTFDHLTSGGGHPNTDPTSYMNSQAQLLASNPPLSNGSYQAHYVGQHLPRSQAFTTNPPQIPSLPPNAIAGPSYTPTPQQLRYQQDVQNMPPPNTHPYSLGHMPPPNYHFGMPPNQMRSDGWGPGGQEWDDEGLEYREGNELIYGSLEVSSNPITSPIEEQDAFNNHFSPSTQDSQSIPSPLSPSGLFLSPCDFVSVPPPSPRQPQSGKCGKKSARRQAYPSLPTPSGSDSEEYESAQPPQRDQEQTPYESYHDAYYTSVKVKHRRRTTPEQLKVLEHWFNVNPKPDNNLREWLAMELGMTKRNIQVWFQNRRAKVKGLAAKEKNAAAKAASDANQETSTTPENQVETPPNSAPPALTQSQPTPSPVKPRTHVISASDLPQRPPPLHMESQPALPTQPQLGLLPPVNGVNMGRRVSLANGEAAKIEMFIAKQRMAAKKATEGAGFVSPIRSPVVPLHQAAMARRSSIPYPSPIPEGAVAFSNPGGSPKISPNVRQMPSSLHLAAIRNNTRRSSVPGLPQVHLLSSGPFTPPRMVSSSGQDANGLRMTRELSPIKDQDPESGLGLGNVSPQDGMMFNSNDLSTTYLTPPTSSYLPNATSNTFFSTDGSMNGGYSSYSIDSATSSLPPFTPNAPLPNPGFSFGSTPDSAQQPQSQGADDQAAMFFAQMQSRGRMGSIASINTYTTDGGTTEAGSEWGSDWNVMGPEGFDPDLRRASAPADLLHNLGILGINTNLPQQPMRPSPLNATYAPDFSYSTAAADANSSQASPMSLTSGQPSPSDQERQQHGKGVQLSLSMSALHPNFPNGSYPNSNTTSAAVSPYSAHSSASMVNGYSHTSSNGSAVNGQNVGHGGSRDDGVKDSNGSKENDGSGGDGNEDYDFFAQLNDANNVLA